VRPALTQAALLPKFVYVLLGKAKVPFIFQLPKTYLKVINPPLQVAQYREHFSFKEFQ